MQSAGALAQRQKLAEELKPPPPPRELLRIARKPPRNTGDLVAVLSLVSCALIERRISRTDFEGIVGAVKLQAELLRESGGAERDQLVALAGLTDAEARDFSDEQLAVMAREKLGTIGPPS